jgi:regulator of protease activity HflC (stomatin/prohibitin superfamily)
MSFGLEDAIGTLLGNALKAAADKEMARILFGGDTVQVNRVDLKDLNAIDSKDAMALLERQRAERMARRRLHASIQYAPGILNPKPLG